MFCCCYADLYIVIISIYLSILFIYLLTCTIYYFLQLDDNNEINEMKMEVHNYLLNNNNIILRLYCIFLQTINNTKYIYASTISKIYRIPLERCDRHILCSSCIDSRDPYCVWNIDTQKCEVNHLSANGAAMSAVPAM